MNEHDCPLCGHAFVGDEGCPTSCPMAKGCGMIKCPQCHYEWVERSRILDTLSGWAQRLRGRKAA